MHTIFSHYRIRILCTILALCIAGASVYFMRATSQIFNIPSSLKFPHIIPAVVIGSGPAGSGAALYLARQAVDVVVFEGRQPGGQLTKTTHVENWPGTISIMGPQLVENLKQHAEQAGAFYSTDSVVSVDFNVWPFVIETEEGLTVRAYTVVIATGSYPRRLNVPGEEQYWGRGVSSCALCDAAFFKDKQVVVVGGGDSAFEEGLQLSPYARHVTILVRSQHARATARMQERVQQFKNISIEYNRGITHIEGDGDKVTHIVVEDTQTHQAEKREIDGVFLAIGHVPNSEIFAPYVARESSGHIIAYNRTQHTSCPGVFVAGDVADHVYMQAGKAAGDGTAAGIDAARFLMSAGYSPEIAQELRTQNIVRASRRSITGMIPQVTSVQELNKAIDSSDIVVCELYTDGCPPCKALAPVFDSVAHELSDIALFIKVFGPDAEDIIRDRRIAITKYPAIIVFVKGQFAARYYPDMSTLTRTELIEHIRAFIR